MIGPAAGIIGFILYSVSLVVFDKMDTFSYPFAITLGLAITFLVNIPGTALLLAEGQKNFEEKTTAALDGIGKSMEREAADFRTWTESLQEKRFRIHQVAPETVSTRMEASMLNSDVVRNTYVNLHRVTGVSTTNGQELIDLYHKVLAKDKNAKWIDIAGVEDFLDGRYYKVAKKGKDIRGTHEVNIISDSLPIINFMLLGKNGRSVELYFGWLKNDTTFSDVYYSKDTRMIGMFEKYFELLLNYKKEQITVDYSAGKRDAFKKLTVDMIRGNWLSVSTSNSIQKPEDYTKYSLINIHVDNGNWVVQGTVFERRTGKIIHVIKCLSASVFEGGIFYRFERTNADGGNVVRGHGTYTLTASEEDAAIGVYVALDDKKGPVQNLRAVKIDSRPTSDSAKPSAAEVNKLIEKIHQTKETRV